METKINKLSEQKINNALEKVDNALENLSKEEQKQVFQRCIHLNQLD